MFGLPSASSAGHEVDRSEVRQAVAEGNAIPFADLQRKVETRMAGAIVDVSLYDLGALYYRVLVRQTDGRVVSAVVDARTGTFLPVSSPVARSVQDAARTERRGGGFLGLFSSPNARSAVQGGKSGSAEEGTSFSSPEGGGQDRSGSISNGGSVGNSAENSASGNSSGNSSSGTSPGSNSAGNSSGGNPGGNSDSSGGNSGGNSAEGRGNASDASSGRGSDTGASASGGRSSSGSANSAGAGRSESGNTGNTGTDVSLGASNGAAQGNSGGRSSDNPGRGRN